MAPNRREQERLRQARLADQRAEQEALAKRRGRRRYAGAGGFLVLIALVAVAIASSRGSSPSSTPQAVAASPTARTAPSGPLPPSAAAVLTTNTRQANQVLDSTISARLAQLKGVPVVVNQWASWCSNCRAEFPYFQQAGRQDAGRVAFVGLDSQDSKSNAKAFLRQFPVTYPSIFDPSSSQAQALGGGQGWPTTIFFDSAHKITNVHVGAYPSRQALQQDIANYT
ncbi:MAG: TlpA family protein disulfide reductase [Solirubrobacteraceae bacterium]